MCPTTISAIYYNSYAKLQFIITETNKLYFIESNGRIYGAGKVSSYFPAIKNKIDASYKTKELYNKERTILFVGSQ